MNGRAACGEDGREHGFTLIEVLVAFTIVAILLAALMQGFSRGLRGIAAAEAQAELIEQAQNILADVGPRIPLEPGLETGEDEGVAWQVEISPAPREENIGPEAERLGLRLFAIDVAVRDADGHEQRLYTLRLSESRS